MDIGAWLREIGLERYEPAFRDNDVETDILPKLTAKDLLAIGVTSVGHRRKLLEAIASLTVKPDRLMEAGTPTEEADVATPTTSQAERRQLTVLFCDLVGSVELSARLDPEDLRHVMRAYQDACAAVLKRWDGHIAKFLGDGVLAYFGYPSAHEDDAERAVRAGLDLTAAVGDLTTDDGSALAARVGIATGLVVVGDLIGEGAAQEEAVVGETPNLAARLEALAEPGKVVIAPNTRKLVGGLFDLVDLGAHELKGFAAPVQAWRAVGVRAVQSRFTERTVHRGYRLIGREAPLEQLKGGWVEACAGRGKIIFVIGEGGIGKSRLAQALFDEVKQDDHIRLIYQCSAFHTNTPLHPVIQTMKRAWGIKPDSSEAESFERLEAALGEHGFEDIESQALMAMMLNLDHAATRYGMPLDSAQQIRRRTLDFLVAYIVRIARHRPVVALLEDAHWIDPTTQALMERTRHAIGSERVLAMITARPSFADHLPKQSTVISLEPLSRAASVDLIQQVALGKKLPRVVIDMVAKRTDGVPLFIEEMTKSVLESEALIETADAFHLTGDLEHLNIPLSLNDVLNARVDRAAASKELIQTAACIGREFSIDLLAAATTQPPQQLEQGLTSLLQAELIRKHSDENGERYAFRHSLIQQAAYGMMLKSARSVTHGRIADALPVLRPSLRDTHPEEVAHHLLAANRPIVALPLCEAAGHHAAHRSAHVEAVSHFQRSLQLIEHLCDVGERRATELRLLMALGPSLMALRGYADNTVAATYRRALQLLDGVEESPAEQIPVLFGLWTYYVVGNQLREALVIGDRLYAMAAQIGDEDLLLEAHVLLGVTHFARGTVELSRRHSETALSLYDPPKHRHHAAIYGQEPGMAATTFLAIALWWLGEEVEALRLAEEALDLAERCDHPFSLAFCLSILARMHMLRGDAAAATPLANRAERLSEQQLFPVWGATATIVAGWADANQEGGKVLGLERMRAGLRAYADIGSALSAPLYRAILLDLEGDTLDPTTALAEIRAIQRDAEAGEGLGDFVEMMRIEAACLRRAGDLEGAERVLRAALDRAKSMKARAWAVRIALDLAQMFARDDHKEEAKILVQACADAVDSAADSPYLRLAVKRFTDDSSISAR